MKDKMAKPLGLTLRGTSFQLRIVIPKDLREAYGGRSDFRTSLGQVPPREAQATAHALRAEKEAEFLAKRKALSGQRVDVTPELAKAIGRAVYARALRQDDVAREDARTVRALMDLDAIATGPLKALQIGPTERVEPPTFDVTEGMPEAAAQVLGDLNARMEADAAIALARRSLAFARGRAEEAVRSMGLAVDWDTEGGRLALREALEQYRTAARDRARRDLGDVVPTPPTEDAPVAATAWTLRDVLAPWESTKRPAANTRNKTEYAVRLFEEKLPGVALRSLTRAQGTDFIAFLLSKCKTEKTAKDHLNSVKALLNFAADQQEWIPGNPWHQHTIVVKRSRPRTPLTSDALVKLFDSPLFREYALPSTTNAGGSAAYWVPLLGLYTGARQSELCQLRTDDVSEEADGLVMSILNDAGDDDEDAPETRVKNATTQRRVPVHSDLMRLGFGDYVKDVKRAGHARLFPDVRQAPGRPAGEYFSDWFSQYRRAQGVTARYQDFHAFRHTSRTRLTDAGVEGGISSALMGHTTGRDTGRRVYDHSTRTLRPNLEKLAYPELRLERVYRKR